MPKIEFDQYGLLKASINSFGLNMLLLASGIFAFDLFDAKEFKKKKKFSEGCWLVQSSVWDKLENIMNERKLKTIYLSLGFCHKTRKTNFLVFFFLFRKHIYCLYMITIL